MNEWKIVEKRSLFVACNDIPPFFFLAMTHSRDPKVSRMRSKA